MYCGQAVTALASAPESTVALTWSNMATAMPGRRAATICLCHSSIRVGAAVTVQARPQAGTNRRWQAARLFAVLAFVPFVGFAVRDTLEGRPVLGRWSDVLVTALLLLTLAEFHRTPHRCGPGLG